MSVPSALLLIVALVSCPGVFAQEGEGEGEGEGVLPTADFTASPTSGDRPLTVQFTDTSDPGSDIIILWQRDFSDGGSSVDQNPAHGFVDRVHRRGKYEETARIRGYLSCGWVP